MDCHPLYIEAIIAKKARANGMRITKFQTGLVLLVADAKTFTTPPLNVLRLPSDATAKKKYPAINPPRADIPARRNPPAPLTFASIARRVRINGIINPMT
jgi:hypothetical protein